jgi:hypothetical protein
MLAFYNAAGERQDLFSVCETFQYLNEGPLIFRFGTFLLYGLSCVLCLVGNRKQFPFRDAALWDDRQLSLGGFSIVGPSTAAANNLAMTRVDETQETVSYPPETQSPHSSLLKAHLSPFHRAIFGLAPPKSPQIG